LVGKYVFPDPSGRTVSDVYLRPLASRDCEFEFPLEHGCLSLVIVVCRHIEVSATGRSLVQGSPTKCGVSECDGETLPMRRPRSCRVWMVLGRRKSLDLVI